MTNPLWLFGSASVLGVGHQTSGLPCQDSCVVKSSDNGQWVAMVASDGAGTAAHSDISSKYISNQFATTLIDMATELDRKRPGAWVTDAVIESIVGLRKHLRHIANSDDDISQYHCTLVAALVGPSGGLAIHLGDGAVFGGYAGLDFEDSVDLSRDYFVSLPQNGEYANETVFLTERDWIKHLRIDPIPALNWLVLGSDGGMALAMVGEKLPKTGFISPVLKSLLENSDQPSRDAAIHGILSDKQADRLTNDDKTLVAVVRSKISSVGGTIKDSSPDPSASKSSLTVQMVADIQQDVPDSSQNVTASRPLGIVEKKISTLRVFSVGLVLIALCLFTVWAIWASIAEKIPNWMTPAKAQPESSEALVPRAALSNPPIAETKSPLALKETL